MVCLTELVAFDLMHQLGIEPGSPCRTNADFATPVNGKFGWSEIAEGGTRLSWIKHTYLENSLIVICLTVSTSAIHSIGVES